jgi:HPt (histidine-containing phosphotransfer) domain-containing protein
LTANVFAQQIKEYRAAGLSDHIGKPVQLSRLLTVIERWTNADNQALASDGMGAGLGGVNRLGQARLSQELGQDKFSKILRSFQGDLQGRLMVKDVAALKRDAHAIMSAAEFLGYNGLADIARETEHRLRHGTDPEAARERLAAARAATVVQIDAYLQNARSTETG